MNHTFENFINTIFRTTTTFKDVLQEKLITFNNKVYPKFGNVVILAGGAGSGKGFINSNLIGLEGKVFDVDALKTMAMKAPLFSKKVKEETGYDIKDLDLKIPENVSLLHKIVGITFNVPNKQRQTLMTSILSKDPNRKPNIIFDVTLQNITKLHNISSMLENAGYDKKNIHIVWVVNKLAVAMKQNLERKRVVPEDIFLATHKGAALTMKEIIDMGDKVKQYMNGDIWIAFNQVGVDSNLGKSSSGGKYIKTSDFVNLKKAGKSIDKNKLTGDILNKIREYVPKSENW